MSLSWNIQFGKLRIGCKQHERMNPPCIESVTQAAVVAIMLLVIASWDTIGSVALGCIA